MKAIILCAGYGERLKPLTNLLPKPLFPVVGHPLLGHIIYYLKQFGVNEIGINTHWLSDKITEYISDGNQFGIKFHISHEPQILGIGGGIGAMRDFLNEDIFIVHNGDILSNINLTPVIEYHIKERVFATLILHNYPKFNNVMVRADKSNFCEIIDIGERLSNVEVSSAIPRFAFTGIAIMDKKILSLLPYKEPCSMIDIWMELIKKNSLRGYILEPSPLHYWAEIGSLSGYLNIHHAILVDRIPLISNSPDSDICIGKNSTLSELTNIIGFASIGSNCVIEAKVVLENCIVWDNTVVKSGTKAKNAVLYPNGKLNAE